MTYAELKSLSSEYGIEVYQEDVDKFFVGIPAYGDCCHTTREKLPQVINEYVGYVKNYKKWGCFT